MIFAGSSEAYDAFMGRYSRQLAARFADFAGVGEGMRVLDVGAGSGALTAELARRGASVAAAEPSQDFAATLRERFPTADLEVAPADALPWPDATFDRVLSQLVLVFLPDAPAAMREQRRVLRDGGVAAAAMWELGGIEAIEVLNGVRDRLQPGGAGPRLERWRSEAELRALFEESGFGEVETTTLEVAVEYASVDELWDPAVHAAGPDGSAASRMPPEAVEAGRRVAAEILGDPAGPFTLRARCACVRGTR